VAGLVIGLVAAYARDRSDDTIRDAGNLSGTLDDVPLLAEITTSASPHRMGSAAHTDVSSQELEVYRLLATDVRVLAARSEMDRGARGVVVMVSSAVQGEGKTTLAVNLAVAAARTGSRVILVDADLRQSDIGARFALNGAPGFSEAVTAEGSSPTLLQEVGVRNLQVLGAGARVTTSGDPATSPHASAVIAELRERADLVIVDTPGLLEFADALQLAAVVDHVVVATRAGTSRSTAVRDVVKRNRRAGRASLSAVLFHFDTGRGLAPTKFWHSAVDADTGGTRHRAGRSSPFRHLVPRRSDRSSPGD
jgi:receptor protein-tyrosine kinase